MNLLERFATALPQRHLSELLLFFLQTDHRLIEVARKYILFIFGGGIGLLLAIGITALFTEVFQWHPRFSYILGLSAAIVFTFIFHSFITFSEKSQWKSRFSLFAGFVIFLSILNYLITTVLFEVLPNIHYIIIIFAVTLMISVINYSVNRWWIFR